jgi:hypothetical protein
MERNHSPVSNSESLAASSPPSSPSHEDGAPEIVESRKQKKASRKKRKNGAPSEDGADLDPQVPIRKHKKPKQRRKQVRLVENDAPVGRVESFQQ